MRSAKKGGQCNRVRKQGGPVLAVPRRHSCHCERHANDTVRSRRGRGSGGPKRAVAGFAALTHSGLAPRAPPLRPHSVCVVPGEHIGAKQQQREARKQPPWSGGGNAVQGRLPPPREAPRCRAGSVRFTGADSGARRPVRPRVLHGSRKWRCAKKQVLQHSPMSRPELTGPPEVRLLRQPGAVAARLVTLWPLAAVLQWARGPQVHTELAHPQDPADLVRAGPRAACTPAGPQGPPPRHRLRQWTQRRCVSAPLGRGRRLGRAASLSPAPARPTRPSEVLTSAGHAWVGFDVSRDMLDVGKSKGSAGDLVQHDMGHGMPLRPGMFDGAIRCAERRRRSPHSLPRASSVRVETLYPLSRLTALLPFLPPHAQYFRGPVALLRAHQGAGPAVRPVPSHIPSLPRPLHTACSPRRAPVSGSSAFSRPCMCPSAVARAQCCSCTRRARSRWSSSPTRLCAAASPAASSWTTPTGAMAAAADGGGGRRVPCNAPGLTPTPPELSQYQGQEVLPDADGRA